MERTKYIRPGVTVELSAEACIQGFSAFANNTYVARLEFEDGRVVVVALPPNARNTRDIESIVTDAVEAAVDRAYGSSVFL